MVVEDGGRLGRVVVLKVVVVLVVVVLGEVVVDA